MQDRLALVKEALRGSLGIEVDRPQVITLKGDASSRSYHRVGIPGHTPPTVVIMELAADPLRSDELTDWVPPEYPFTLVHGFLESGGLPVPRIYGARPDEGWLVLEDLGDLTLERILGGTDDWRPWYERAVDLLAAFRRRWSKDREGNPVRARRFSRRLLGWELEHYVEWGLEARLGIELEPGQRACLGSAFAPLLDGLEKVPVCLVHRDFQSRNLMVREDGQGLVIIDFQDALMGPAVYDAVALLNDSYVEVPVELQDEMAERLRRAVEPDIDPETWRHWFDMQAVQRKLKDAGRFVFIDRVKGNPGFLPYVGRSLAYVRRALERRPGLADLQRQLESLGGLDEH